MCGAENLRSSRWQTPRNRSRTPLARAIRPLHTMFDGDTVFALATGEVDPEVLKGQAAWGNMAANIIKIGAAVADALSRAVVHAMLNAETVGAVASYRDKYPGAFKK